MTFFGFCCAELDSAAPLPHDTRLFRTQASHVYYLRLSNLFQASLISESSTPWNNILVFKASATLFGNTQQTVQFGCH